MAFATFLVWRLRTGACGFWRYRKLPCIFLFLSDENLGASNILIKFTEFSFSNMEIQMRECLFDRSLKVKLNYFLFFFFRTLNTSQLFRQSILQQSSTPGSLHASQSSSTPNSHTEIWRSETVAQVFVDFWLNYGESDTNVYGRATPPRVRIENLRYQQGMKLFFQMF